jgi:gamma-butyrobetaine dioxygenase
MGKFRKNKPWQNAMNFHKIQPEKRSFLVTWEDGSISEMPYVWLRDNDQDELHPQTGERTFDLTTISLDIAPNDFSLTLSDQADASKLSVSWPAKETLSHYTAKWLYEHRPGRPRYDAARIEKQSWAQTKMTSIPRFDARACNVSGPALLDALKTLKQTGIILVHDLDDDPSAGEKFGDLIGFKRESNYGVMFEVQSKPDPNNLAYTSLALPLHTDLSNQEFVPGNQFLHCYRNEATGGGSVFADAMAIVEDFKLECPKHFQTLVELSVPWHFLDEKDDVRFHRPVIGLDRNGNFNTLTFNAHLADIPDFSAELLHSFYAAYRELMSRIRSASYNIEYVLKNGEMVIFDNQRALHGRASFDPSSGKRHLRGYYIEHNEINSRIRMLDKQL